MVSRLDLSQGQKTKDPLRVIRHLHSLWSWDYSTSKELHKGYTSQPADPTTREAHERVRSPIQAIRTRCNRSELDLWKQWPSGVRSGWQISLHLLREQANVLWCWWCPQIQVSANPEAFWNQRIIPFFRRHYRAFKPTPYTEGAPHHEMRSVMYDLDGRVTCYTATTSSNKSLARTYSTPVAKWSITSMISSKYRSTSIVFCRNCSNYLHPWDAYGQDTLFLLLKCAFLAMQQHTIGLWWQCFQSHGETKDRGTQSSSSSCLINSWQVSWDLLYSRNFNHVFQLFYALGQSWTHVGNKPRFHPKGNQLQSHIMHIDRYKLEK